MKKIRQRATCEKERLEEEELVQTLITNVQRGITVREDSAPAPKKVTEFKEFNLSKAKVRKLPPILKVEARPKISKKIRMGNKTLVQIEAGKLQRRKGKQKEANLNYKELVKGVELKSEARVLRRKRKKAVEMEKEKKNKQAEELKRLKNKPKIDYKGADRDLFYEINRETKAAVLKGERVIEEEKAEEILKVKELEMGMGDSQEFQKWKQQGELQKRKREEANRLQNKRKIAEIYKNAVGNKIKLKEQRKEEVEEEKKKRKLALGEKEKEEERKGEQMKKKCEEIKEDRAKIHEKIEREKRKKLKQADLEREQKEFRKEKKKQRNYFEFQQRQKLIQQIKDSHVKREIVWSIFLKYFLMIFE